MAGVDFFTAPGQHSRGTEFDLGVGLPGQWDVLGEECGLDLLGRVTDTQ